MACYQQQENKENHKGLRGRKEASSNITWYNQQKTVLTSQITAALPEVSENETVCIQWIILSDQTLYALPI